MTLNEYAELKDRLTGLITSARGLTRAVYTGKASDSELGKALDAIMATGFALAAHAENTSWYERLEQDFMDDMRGAQEIVRGVYTGDRSDAELGKALDYLAIAERTLAYYSKPIA